MLKRMFGGAQRNNPFINGVVTRTIFIEHNKALVEIVGGRGEVRTLMTYEGRRILAFVQEGYRYSIRYREPNEEDDRHVDFDDHGVLDGVITHVEAVIQDYEDD